MNEPVLMPKALLKERIRLNRKRYRHEEGLVVIDGVRILTQLADAKITPLEIYTTGATDPFPGGIPRYLIAPDDLKRLTDTEQPQALAALLRTDPPAYRETPIQLYLDRIADPGNLGTILRTAAAAGISVLLSTEGCDPFNPKAIRASLGAVFYHPWKWCPEDDLVHQPLPLLAADMDGESIWSVRSPERFILVIGSEAHGLSPVIRAQAQRISIPLRGNMESLNAAMAAGIAMFVLQAARL